MYGAYTYPRVYAVYLLGPESVRSVKVSEGGMEGGSDGNSQKVGPEWSGVYAVVCNNNENKFVCNIGNIITNNCGMTNQNPLKKP